MKKLFLVFACIAFLSCGIYALQTKKGNNITGNSTVSGNLTVSGSSFSVGGSTLVVSGGQVGIGATPSNANLDVRGYSGAGNFVVYFTTTTTPVSTSFRTYYNGTGNWIVQSGTSYNTLGYNSLASNGALNLYAGGANTMVFNTNSTDRMTLGATGSVAVNGSNFSVGGSTLVVSGGKIGIGTATADSKQTVGLTINQGANDDNILALQSSDISQPFTATLDATGYGSFQKINPDYGGLFIKGYSDSGDGNALHMRGYIGTQSVPATVSGVILSAAKSDGSTGQVVLASTECVMQVNNYTTTGLFRIMGNGNVGISSTTPTYLLTMEDGNAGGYYSASDQQWHNGASFAEYKENIKNVKLANPILSLKNVKLRQYNYKGEKKKVFGYVADELPPNLASYMIDTNGGLTMNGLFVYATSVMQAQQKVIDGLIKRINDLEERLSALELK